MSVMFKMCEAVALLDMVSGVCDMSCKWLTLFRLLHSLIS